ncbi:MAG: Crp/Fnr family transcriptional regulator [Chitinophagaceae bacterium]|nr:Crp/Fnr family transcriptional regulator [Chitinophagaceae bacterium]
MGIALRQQIEKIVPLTNDEFELVLSHFTERNFRKHQIIVHEGDYVSYDFYVVKGLMKSSHTNPEGKEHIIQFGLEDWWITDPQAFHCSWGMVTPKMGCGW